MNIFFYSSGIYAAGCDLRRRLMAKFPNQYIAIFSNIKDLSTYLGLAIRNNDLVVMALDSMTELEELLTVRFLLEDARLIVLLPKMDKESLAKAHLLRPRYLSSGDINPAQVCAILDKMQNHNS